MHASRPASRSAVRDDHGRAPGPLARTTAHLVVRGADAATRLVSRLLGTSATAGRESISSSELRDLVAVNTTLPGEERRIIREVIETGTRHVREVMVPRTDVLFLQADLTVAAAALLVRDGRHSRFPVVDGSPDEVLGFVHLRDLLIRPAGDPVTTVAELTRDVKRLPGSKRLLAALSEMRREGQHLAVVEDEYGGTAGIVTLEDLIEELIGEIHDEYDPAPEPATDGVPPPEVDGRLNLADLADLTGLVLPPGPYETLGGYLMAMLGRMPAVGDEVVVRVGPSVPALLPCRITVAALDGHRVDRVALGFGVTAPDQPPAEPVAGPRAQPAAGQPATGQPAPAQPAAGRPTGTPVRPADAATAASRAPDPAAPYAGRL